MTITELEIGNVALSARPLRGLGVQMDSYIFDESNRACGVTQSVAEGTVTIELKPLELSVVKE